MRRFRRANTRRGLQSFDSGRQHSRPHLRLDGASRGRLHEKGGKVYEMPCHHTLEGYLAEYLERTQLADAGRVSPSSRPSNIALMVAGWRSSMVSGSTASTLGRWCAGGREPQVSPPRCATTLSAALASRPIWKTVACSKRPARCRRMRRPAPRSGVADLLDDLVSLLVALVPIGDRKL